MTNPSHNLGLVSQDQASEKRRVPRINLAQEQFKLSANGKVFSVADLSRDGFAIRVLELSDLILFSVGAPISGTLNVDGQKLSVFGRVAHLRADLVGAQFGELEAKVRNALEAFLDPAHLGKELKLRPHSSRDVVWYTGPSGTHLFFGKDAQGVSRKVSALVLGSYVQWEEGLGLTTGTYSFSEDRDEVYGALRLETVLFKADPSVDSAKTDLAKRLVLGSNLSQDLKDWLLRRLG
jgi:hypothetical protein